MEIELPDGTVLDAPDNADVKSVVRGYNLAQLKTKNPAEYDSSSPAYQAKYGPMATGTRKEAIRGLGEVEISNDNSFTEGIGSGMKRMATGLTNAGIKVMNKHPLIHALGVFPTPTNSTDEAIQQQDVTDQPLAATGKGAAGQLLGQTAVAYGATAPVGALGSLSKAGSMLPRALGNPLTRTALEGGATGAGAANPDEQGVGALQGAGLGLAANRIMAGGGRALSGIVQKNEATKALQQLAGQQGEDIFVPISQAADTEGGLLSKGAKIAYGEGLSLVPGVKGQLQRQSEDAAEKLRELAIKEATPTGVYLPDRPGKNVQESLASIRNGFDEAYDQTIGSLDFRIPGDLRKQLEAKIRQASPNIDDESMDKGMLLARGLLRRFSESNGMVEGSNLRHVMREMEAKIAKAPEHEAVAYKAALDVVKDMIPQRLKVQGLLDRYNDLEEPARHMVGLEKAVYAARAKSGRFSPTQLANNAKDMTQLDLAQTGAEALKGSPAGTSFAGRSLLGGAATLAGAVASPIGAGTALVGANLLATKTAQKALMGDLAAQRSIVDLLQKNPEMADVVKKALQTAAATEQR